MGLRLPRPWYSQEERDAGRFENGRQGAFARAGRQAADRDRLTPGSGNWRPGAVPRPRNVRAQERQIQQRRNSDGEARRASVLARAMEQATNRDRAEDNQRHVRETLAARQPEYARTVERAAREVSPRAGRRSR